MPPFKRRCAGKAKWLLVCPRFKRAHPRRAPHHPLFTMSSRRSSNRTQQPAQRRPRTEKACNFCRIARQRCEPTEYGINDRPCRRCVSQGLECNLSRTTRSQSPSSAFGAQGPAPIQHHISHSAGGVAEELTPGSETTLQYILPQSESAGVPMMGGWSPPVIFSEGEQGPGTTGLGSGQATLRMSSYLPRTSSMEGYQQSFSNAAEVGTDPDY